MAAINSSNSNASSVSSSYYGLTPAAKPTGLDMSTFISLLVSELQNQDPTQPMSSTDMFSQMSQLGQVQGINALNSNAQMQEAQSLVGKTITGLYTDSKTGRSASVTGLVTGASMTDGTYTLSVSAADGSVKSVSLANVQSVQPSLDPTTAASLIGKRVTGTVTIGSGSSAQSESITGTVTSIVQSSGSTLLNVKTDSNGTVQMQSNAITGVSS